MFPVFTDIAEALVAIAEVFVFCCEVKDDIADVLVFCWVVKFDMFVVFVFCWLVKFVIFVELVFILFVLVVCCVVKEFIDEVLDDIPLALVAIAEVFVFCCVVKLVMSVSLLVICVWSPALKSWNVIFFVKEFVVSYMTNKSAETGLVKALGLFISKSIFEVLIAIPTPAFRLEEEGTTKSIPPALLVIVTLLSLDNNSPTE